MKTCIRCVQTKDLSSYWKNNRRKDGLSTVCKICTSKRRNTEVRKSKYVQERYGINLDQFKALLASQNGTCAICAKEETIADYRGVRALSIDHDHVSNKVRGILCMKCNRALGGFCDSIELLERAVAYLKDNSK